MTNNMKDQLTIKNNERHKFSNFGESWTLNFYCETHRIVSDTICFLKNAGSVFWFKASLGEAITCEQLLKFIKIKDTNFYISIFLANELDLIFQYEIFSSIQNRLWEYGSTKHICQEIHSHFEFLCFTAKSVIKILNLHENARNRAFVFLKL